MLDISHPITIFKHIFIIHEVTSNLHRIFHLNKWNESLSRFSIKKTHYSPEKENITRGQVTNLHFQRQWQCLFVEVDPYRPQERNGGRSLILDHTDLGNENKHKNRWKGRLFPFNISTPLGKTKNSSNARVKLYFSSTLVSFHIKDIMLTINLSNHVMWNM